MAGKDGRALKEFIVGRVRLHDYLTQDGRTTFPDVEHQLKCPFHGSDNKPSTRYYDETNSMYCFVCKKSWDPIGYIADSRAIDYRSAMAYIVRDKRLDVSSVPDYSESARNNAAKMVSRAGKTAINPDGLKVSVAAIEGMMRTKRKKIPGDKFGKLLYILPRLKKAAATEAAGMKAKEVEDFLRKL